MLISDKKQMSLSEIESRLLRATEITEVAAKVALSHFRNNIDIESKADQSPVTIADKQTEQAIRDGLRRIFPNDAVFGEEFGQTNVLTDLMVER